MRIWLAALVLTACGSSSPEHAADAMVTIDAGTPDGSWRLADRMPREVVKDKTAIMASPVVVPITFDDDPDVDSIPQFYDAFGSSSAWTDETAEYGVGPMTAGAAQSLGPMPSSTTLAGLLDTLTQNLSGAAPPWGHPDENTLYAFHIPDGVKLDDGQQCCMKYDGFHSATMVGTTQVAYAIDCACPGEATFLGITDLEERTITMAHEVLEASTDPRDNRGWSGTDDAHAAWSYIVYTGELGDLCEYADTAPWLTDSSGFAVQRTWSNKAAAAGHDPCVGEPTKPYYQTIPDDPDSTIVTFMGLHDGGDSLLWRAKGTRIAVGATGTINLRVLTDDPTSGPFEIIAYDMAGLVTFGFISGTYMPNEPITVSATVHAKDPNLQGGEAYVVATKPVSGGGPTTYYYALIVQ